MNVAELAEDISKTVLRAFKESDPTFFVLALEQVATAYQESRYSDVGKFMKAKYLDFISNDLVSYQRSWANPDQNLIVLDLGRVEDGDICTCMSKNEMLVGLDSKFTKNKHQFYVNHSTQCLGIYLS